MTVISYNQLDDFLAQSGDPVPVYLIFGENYLCQSALKKLTACLIPENRREFDLYLLDGTEDNLYQAIEQMNTYALDSSTRVIGFCDTKLFYSSADTGGLIQQIKSATAKDDLRQSGMALMKLLSLMGLDLTTLTEADKQQILSADNDPGDGSSLWLDQLLDYCRDLNFPPPTATDPVASLQKAIEKSFAPGNYLVITTDVVDKRRKLFKTIKDHGHIVDCTVAAGDSRAAREEQQRAVTEMTASALRRWGKKIDREASRILIELTGFDLRTIHSSLEKLATYTGSRETITADDVGRLLKRTRTDPIYALTDAVFSKKYHQALLYLENLLSGVDPMYPTQIIAAILNQVRKLLIIRDFMETDQGRVWKNDVRFDVFRRSVLPVVEKYDAATATAIEKRKQALESSEEKEKKPVKGPKSKPAPELTIAPDTGNPYPVYKNFEKAACFTKSELLAIFASLHKADRQLKKTSEKDPTGRLILERLIMGITGQKVGL